MSKLSQIQSLFKQLRPCLEDQMTPEQKKTYDKLSIIFKDLSKSQKQFGIQNNEQFFTSLKIQLYSLKKDVLNNKKANMSDYEIFLWKHQLYKNNKETFNYIEFTDIVEKITLPKRAINGGIPQTSSLAIMKDFSFCPLGRSINDIVELSLEIIFDNSYCQKNFNKQLMGKLVHQMAKQYQVVSYHNFTHAFSVQLMLFQCMQTSPKLKALFTPFEAFIAYISALAHDIGHYGTNSDFEIKKKSQVAKSYSNQSVLENMHVAKFWRMLRKHPELDIISQIKDPVERQRSKRLIIRLILGTDVSKHFQSLARYNSLQKQDLNSLSMLQKQVIHENLFHACDIGNCCLEFDDFMNWARLLSYEFNSQYEMELQSNVQPSAMFKYNGEKAFYQGQVGFIDFLAAPLWKTINETFPQLAKLSQTIWKNKQKLKKLIESSKQKQSH